MELVVSPVLHNSEPVKPVAVNKELPQLLVAFIAGAGIVVLNGAAIAVVGALGHPFMVCVTE